MGKRLVNVRIDDELLATFDAWVDRHDWTRTRAIERLMLAAVADDLPAGDDTQQRTRSKPRSAGSASARGARSPSPAVRDVTPRLKGMKQ